MTVTNDIRYVGVNDHKLDLFESQYIVPLGMAYNSYLILDDQIAVMDTVAEGFGDEWLANIEKETGGKAPSFLVVHHVEPDHSANIIRFTKKYPDAKVVSCARAFTMLGNFYGTDLADRQYLIKEGDDLCLGVHTLSFYSAPMIHWPEVMMSYDERDKVLFSADAFGKFGANDVEDPEGWACEARRYYFGIVGKYGQQVQAVLQKLKGLDIRVIAPLHGPVLSGDLSYYLSIYDTWSSYRPEESGVTIACASIHGNTYRAAQELRRMLEEKGVKVALSDLTREDMPEIVEDAFRYDRLVLAASTYNMDVFPCMRTFISALAERGYKSRKIGLVENGSWAPNAGRVMSQLLEPCKDITYCQTRVTITSALNDASREKLRALAAELAE